MDLLADFYIICTIIIHSLETKLEKKNVDFQKFLLFYPKTQKYLNSTKKIVVWRVVAF